MQPRFHLPNLFTKHFRMDALCQKIMSSRNNGLFSTTQAWPIDCGLICIDGSMSEFPEVVKQTVLKDESYTFSVTHP